jgi:hypothetical protein
MWPQEGPDRTLNEPLPEGEEHEAEPYHDT